MSPHDFARLFSTVASAQEAAMVEVAGSRAGHYTAWFSDAVVPAMGEQTKLNLHRESYPARIDYVLSPDTTWPHRLDIAIEHEKTGATAEQEVAKLALVNSRLAVLVTYIKALHEKPFLDRYLSIISHLGMLDAFGKERGFLLVLGQHDPWKPITPDNRTAWRFFSLEGGNWRLIDVPRPPQTAGNVGFHALPNA